MRGESRARKKQRRRELELECEPEAIDAGFIEAVTLLAWQIMYNSNSQDVNLWFRVCACIVDLQSCYCRKWFRDTIRGDLFDVTFQQLE
jgi:hypothetical protein